jgi:hypothetical protein
VDEITDFDSGVDQIDLTELGDLTWIDGAAFSGLAGELRHVQAAGDTFVQVDVDGDGVLGSGDLEVQLTGVAAVIEADFAFA